MCSRALDNSLSSIVYRPLRGLLSMQLSYLLLGLLTGVLGGLLGIGGASFVVPALVLLYGFSQHDAPAWRYWQGGHVKVGPAALIALGFFVGGYIGAVAVQHIPDLVLKRVFGVYLLVIAARMICGK